MSARSLLALSLALSFGCGPRQVTGDDDVAASESTTESTTETTSSSTTTGDSESTIDSESSSEESGPTPDVPDDLPVECVPVNFLESEGNQPTEVWAGWVYCKDDFFRIEAIDCPYEAGFGACGDPEGCDGCDPTEECVEWYAGSGYCFCAHNCVTDSDCGTNEICACRSGVVARQLTGLNRCLPANCSGQADCAAVPDESAPRCRLGEDLCGSPSEVRCRTDVDSCLYDEDCPNWWCRYDQGDELWSCDEPAICE